MNLRSLVPEIAPGERIRVQHAAAALVCAGAAGIVGKTVGTAVFLNHFPASRLAYMYIAAALLVTLTFYGYRKLLARWPERRVRTVLAIVIVVLLAAVRLGLALPGGGFRIAAYLIGDLVAKVPLVLFWGFAAMLFNPREGKRLFPMIGVAGTLACAVAGFAIPVLTSAFGTVNLIFVVMLLVAGFAVAIEGLYRREPGTFKSAGPAKGGGANPTRAGYYAELLKTDLVRGLGLLVMVATASLILFDFVFMSAAKASYSGDALAAFFGKFWAAASVLSVLVQVFAVRFVLQRGGVAVALMVLPAALLLGASGAALTAAFLWVVATKMAEPVFLYTVDNAALQMLYMGIKKQTRTQVRAFIDGLCKPLATVAAGVLLIVLGPRVEPRYLAAAVAVLCFGWLYAARKSAAAYVSGLMDQLGSRRLDLADETVAGDKNLEAQLRGALRTAPDDELPYLFGVLERFEGSDWTPEYRALLDREAPAVKVTALAYLEGHGDRSDVEAVKACAAHPAPEVRSAAMHALAALGGHRGNGTIAAGLDDPEPAVRSAAAAALLSVGDLEGLLAGGSALQSALSSAEPEARVAAAEALGHIEHVGVSRALESLLADGDERVRAAALSTAGRRRLPAELVPRVMELLSEPRLGAVAAEVLAGCGEAAIESLAALAEEAGSSRAARRVPVVLARIGGEGVVPVLGRLLAAPDLALRRQASRALHRVLHALPSVEPYRETVEAAATGELECLHHERRTIRALSPLAANEALLKALEDEYRQQLEGTLYLLGVGHPGVDMGPVFRGLASDAQDRRAEAIEVLDNVLRKGELKRRLFELLEPAAEGPAAREAAGPAASGSEELGRMMALSIIDPWVRAAALYCAAEGGLAEHRERAVELLDDPDVCVREAALHAVGRLAGSGVAAEAAGRLAADPEPRVRRLAAEILEKANGG